VDVRQRLQEARVARVRELRPFLAERKHAEAARLDDAERLLGVDRADRVDERSAGPDPFGRRAKQRELELRQRLGPPAEIGPLGEDAETRARSVDERAVEPEKLGRQRRAVGLDDGHVRGAHRGEVRAQLARTVRIDLHRGDLAPELPRLPARRGAEVEHTLAVTGADDETHELAEGGYAFLPPGQRWTLHNSGTDKATFHWIRKAYQVVEGVDVPEAFVTNESDVEGGEMPDTDGVWTTQRFVDPTDVRHDMHVNIVNFEPGGAIPFPETHVMEHGLYVLEGKAVYLLNNDWVEVQEGDFMWLRAFCPQACYAGGPGRFRYLLYKDVNRHAVLSRQFV